MAKDVDTFSAWDGTQPFIFTSRKKTPERSRFDIAHELGAPQHQSRRKRPTREGSRCLCFR
ncbi:ImmA/IrrE family metallo-endopeptidase, partial [Corynebacterium stationis]|uniref:ImmA/IrrE family metallo-endopeptidase n=1 Tax=Corynebacterium stationis TaxID=1705 RepID=UPI00339BD929